MLVYKLFWFAIVTLGTGYFVLKFQIDKHFFVFFKKTIDKLEKSYYNI